MSENENLTESVNPEGNPEEIAVPLQAEQKKSAKEQEKSALRETIDTIVYLVVVCVLTLLFLKYVAQRTIVDGYSMEPNLYDKENLIVDKITYRFHEPERFDIIVFPFRYDTTGKTFYIKRIIGLPGETVCIDEEGNIYIDGTILEENYGKETILEINRGYAAQPITLGDDEYFVLGDNRNNSSDSRFGAVGKLKREEIIGRAIFRFWPLSKFGTLDKE